jgi:Na+-driven multidrug efflux pump
MTAGFLAAELFPRAAASVFTSDKELIDLTAEGLRYMCAVFPLVGFQMVVSMFFQSIGKAGKTIFLSLTRQVLFLIPLIIILPKYLGITGIWLSMPLSDLISAFTAAFLLIMQFREFKKQKQEIV